MGVEVVPSATVDVGAGVKVERAVGVCVGGAVLVSVVTRPGVDVAAGLKVDSALHPDEKITSNASLKAVINFDRFSIFTSCTCYRR